MNAGAQYRIAPVQSELLTVEQAAEFLNMTKGQIHEMTRARGRERMPIPIPLLRINGNLRFRRSSLEKWLNEIEQYELQQSQPPAA
jgi:predicted DNA-binding transcriptional regulator AlpA